jgi:hypothetical protein
MNFRVLKNVCTCEYKLWMLRDKEHLRWLCAVWCVILTVCESKDVETWPTLVNDKYFKELGI